MPRTGPVPRTFFALAPRVAGALLLLLVATACGYRPAGAPPEGAAGNAGGVTSVAVIALRNDSPEPWLDRVVTDALRRELGVRSALRLVSDPQRADYVVRGRVKPLGLRRNSFSSFVVALEYQVTLALELEVLRRQGDVIRLPAATLSENDVYLASPDVEVTRTNRLEALRHLSDVLATRVADRLEWMSRPAIPPKAPGAAGG